MASLAFFGFFFLGIGPGIVFFLYIIAPKSFLVLISFTSAFYWLLVLLVTAAIFRGFVPIPQTAASYAGLLLGAVVIEELARYALWRAHQATSKILDQQARYSGHRYDLIDKLYVALAWGYGHGATHVIFFVLSFLPLTTGDGTWYYAQCPSMSIFLAGALYALAVGMLLPALMVLAFEGYQERHLGHVLYAPAMHLVSALVTLINFRHNGCLAAIPLLLAIGAGNVAYVGRVCWQKGAHKLPPPLVANRQLHADAGLLDADEDDTEVDSTTGLAPHAVGAGQNAGQGPGAARRRARGQAGASLPLVGTDN